MRIQTSIQFVVLMVAAAGCGGSAAAIVEVDAATTDGDVPDDRRGETMQVTARGETAGAAGDPDDPAIWVDRDDPRRSIILGTDKEHGLYLYNLDGSQLQDLPVGEMNSVDLRDVQIGARTVTLVTSGNRSDDTIGFFELDRATRRLKTFAPGLPAGIVIYGHCMGIDRATGGVWVFLDDKEGTMVQWRLDLGEGTVAATEVRRIDVGGQVENCAVDDEHGAVYIGEEAVGIWKYDARPETGAARMKLASTDNVALFADVEGLAIYDAGNGGGYLLASSQGDNAYAIFERRPPHTFVGRFRIIDGAIDGTAESDGIEITSAALPGYPGGIFIAHDTANEGLTGNFKLVAWGDVTEKLGL